MSRPASLEPAKSIDEVIDADSAAPVESSKSTRRSWIKRHFFKPVQQLLGQGLSAEEIARSLALGATIGLSPLVGTTTITATSVAAALRLNLMATLFANYIVYPIQLLLILPLARIGSLITGWSNLPLQPTELRVLITEQGIGSLRTLGTTLMNAAVTWALLTPILFALSYFTSIALIRTVPRLAPRRRNRERTVRDEQVNED